MTTFLANKAFSAGLRCEQGKLFFALIALFSITYGPVSAQSGGRTVFNFLNLPAGSRAAALGSEDLTSEAADPILVFQNPAGISEKAEGAAAFHMSSLGAGITSLSAVYVPKEFKYGRASFGIRYLSYGDFEGYDAAGLPTGSFSAGEYAVSVGLSRQTGPFRLGANLKFVGGSLGGYSASGLALDLGGTFFHPTKDFRIALTIRNLGMVLSDYPGLADGSMPLEIAAGMSFKPERMPLRFTVGARRLQYLTGMGYISRTGTGTLDSFGNKIIENPTFGDKLSRHLTFGAELLFIKNINLLFGYNFLDRKELQTESAPAFTGLSFGLLVRIKKLEFSLSQSVRHSSAGLTSFGIRLNPSELFSGKTIKD